MIKDIIEVTLIAEISSPFVAASNESPSHNVTDSAESHS